MILIKNKGYLLFAKAISIFFLCATNVMAQNPQLPLPNSRQLAWQKAEFGVLFSYDLHIFDLSNYIQANNRITPITDYNIFNPEKLDIRQWIKAAKSAGAKFAIFTVTHETGFALFQSDYNPYSLKAVKWRNGKGDLFREFVDACREYDIQPGVFVGIRWNSFFGVHDFKVDGNSEMQKQRLKYYNVMVEGMVKEICTNYGKLFEIWFDGGASSPEKGAPDVLPIVKKYQPDCLFYHNEQLAEARWGGSESGTVNYPCWATFPYSVTGAGESAKKDIYANDFAMLKTGDPNGKYWMPAMSDLPLRGFKGRHEWFWEPGNELNIFPLHHLVDVYYKSVGRNSTLIMGLTPDNTGLLPEPDVIRLAEFGKEIDRRFSNVIAKTSGNGKTIEIRLSKEVNFDQIVLQENIAKGQKVRAFHVKALVNGKWEKIIEGSSIGNKYIHLLEKPILSKKLKLEITNSVGEPEIDNFSIYYVGNTKV